MSVLWLRINAALIVLVLIALLGITAMLATRTEGGPLDPPGPPGSTTTSVQLPGTPVSGPITITQPGRYYLTGNINVTGAQSAIVISADDVTLDLGGFTVRGDNTVGTYGILVTGPLWANTRIGIINGTVTGFHFGAEVSSGQYVRIDDFHATANVRGIQIGHSSTIDDCSSIDNSETGIFLSSNFSSVENCDVMWNGRDGISLGGSGNYAGTNRVMRNGSASADSAGIRLSGGNVAAANVVADQFTIGDILLTGGSSIVYDNDCMHGNIVENIFGTNDVAVPDHLNIECSHFAP